VVSLAAALAVPFLTSRGTSFPYRDLILFVTFGVIVGTLVFQGLLLPSVVRWLGLARNRVEEREREEADELKARVAAIDRANRRLEELAAERHPPEGVLELLRSRHAARSQQYAIAPSERPTTQVALGAKLRSELIGVEREFLFQLLRDGMITDESRRRLERELDLEEASIAYDLEDEVEPPL
jgi:CPA1 family monovalent cation:H+ antiporter